ncbi:hypothetical protein SOVF_194290 [Spinacia oleracea]|nr:hypothetical protein SOVF_194290 [Spinacia oleracea]
MAQIINLSPHDHRSSLRPQFAFNNSLSRPLPSPESPSQENVTNQELVRVTADTLRMSSDSACPICKQDFLLNQEIQKLECNHFYHSHCIMSWLQINNTCPVCRYRLPIHQHSTNNFQSANYGRNADDNDDDDYDLHLENVVNLSWPSWTDLLSLLRPFRLGSLLDWSLP